MCKKQWAVVSGQMPVERDYFSTDHRQLLTEALALMNEDLIYRITQIVYEHLVRDADEQTIENLVTEIYRSIGPSATLESNGTDGQRKSQREHRGSQTDERQAQTEGASERLIVTVFGIDTPGIVAAVSKILADARCSIIDINQTVVQGKFAMVLIADISRASQSVTELKRMFRKQGEQLGVRIYAQREDLFNAMHRI